MSSTTALVHFETFADVQKRLGHIAPERIVMNPPPGQATEEDLLERMRRTGRLCELVDGVLVDKEMRYLQASLATWISYFLQHYLMSHDLGNLAGADATTRLLPRLVRLPDVSFVRWEKLPGGRDRRLPLDAIPDLVPDLAIEVLSKRNTSGEVATKLKEYFLAGVALVWIVDPAKRTVKVHTSPDAFSVLTEADTLDGGEVLPSFNLTVKQVFERVPLPEPKPRRSTRKK